MTRPTPRSWRRKGGLASWNYRLPLTGSGRVSSSVYADVFAALTGLFDGFARAAEVRVTTASSGEDAHVYGTDRVPAAADELRRVGDVDDIEVALDLSCYVSSSASQPAWLERAGVLWLTRDRHDSGECLSVRLTVDVDIYAYVTWGDSRDNRALAARNGPLLEAFLRGLGDELGAEFDDADALGYDDQLYALGFRNPN